MEKKDVCILCGAETPYYFSTPIHERFGYIEGAGQACYTTSVEGLREGKFTCPDGVSRRNKSIHLKTL